MAELFLVLNELILGFTLQTAKLTAHGIQICLLPTDLFEQARTFSLPIHLPKLKCFFETVQFQAVSLKHTF